jgi:ketosteroid isomerase-like protein
MYFAGKFLTLASMTNISNSASAQTEEEKEVATSIEALRAAMVNSNKAALENAAADDLSYGHSSGHVEGKAEFVDKIASGKSDFVTIEISNQTIRIVGNDAIVRHDLNAQTNDGGNPSSVSLHVLYVWQKQHGQWKMLVRQAVKVKHD